MILDHWKVYSVWVQHLCVCIMCCYTKLVKSWPNFVRFFYKKNTGFLGLMVTILYISVYILSKWKMQILFKLYVSNDVRIFCKRLHSHDWLTEITQPVKSHIDFCFTLSCKWSHLLKSHMITYMKTVFYNLESIHPINMNFCALSLNCRIGQNTTCLFIQLQFCESFW